MDWVRITVIVKVMVFLGKGLGRVRVRVTVKVKVRIKVRAGYRVVTQEGRQGLQCHLRGRWGVRVRDMVTVRVWG